MYFDGNEIAWNMCVFIPSVNTDSLSSSHAPGPNPTMYLHCVLCASRKYFYLSSSKRNASPFFRINVFGTSNLIPVTRQSESTSYTATCTIIYFPLSTKTTKNLFFISIVYAVIAEHVFIVFCRRIFFVFRLLLNSWYRRQFCICVCAEHSQVKQFSYTNKSRAYTLRFMICVQLRWRYVSSVVLCEARKVHKYQLFAHSLVVRRTHSSVN